LLLRTSIFGQTAILQQSFTGGNIDFRKSGGVQPSTQWTKSPIVASTIVVQSVVRQSSSCAQTHFIISHLVNATVYAGFPYSNAARESSRVRPTIQWIESPISAAILFFESIVLQSSSL
jgi:hypothetical protein